ncbi:hypothetical protein HPB49_004124 [Dermacentor silvarum]|uniref:Uncharacterized protein n=1 Tax=Dermacentor silvarum TaxID=543639 RepID=A0ACB8DUK3_DERSI|nr:hypothetical protein HPB49_004124 [Dermacentor silvarum]
MQNIPSVARNTTEAAASKHCSKDGVLATQVTMTAKCETHSLNSTKHFDTKECQASGSIVVKPEAIIIAEDEVIVNEEPERKAPTESDVEDISKQLREFLHEKGPSQEDDLVEAFRPSQAQLILATYGTLSAFLDRCPGFHVEHEDLYSFIYYKEPDDEAGRLCTPLSQDEASMRSACYDSGCQLHAEACDGGPRHASVSSSTSSTYKFAIDAEHDEQEDPRMKDACSQVPSPPRCLS